MYLIPYYSGNIKNSKCIGHITYYQFLTVHKNPKKETQKLINEINEVSLKGDKDKKADLKKGLYTFTPSVIINVGKSRKYVNIDGFTQFKQLDFDNIEDEETAISLKNHVFENNPSILCAYLSPSRLGVKCLLKTTKPEDIEHFRAIHKAVETHFGEYGHYFDSAVKNAILPLFLSIDRDILFRYYDEAETWTKEDWSKTKYVNLNNIPKDYSKTYTDNQKQYYLDKTVKLFREKIRRISADGHPQMRRACLILGSRCGAGYIDRIEAEQLAEQEIKSNEYLQKDLNNYLKTSRWAINEGIKNPKIY